MLPDLTRAGREAVEAVPATRYEPGLTVEFANAEDRAGATSGRSAADFEH